MQSLDRRLIRFVTVLATATGLLVALVIPSIYFGAEYRTLETELTLVARAKEVLLQDVISQDTERWALQTTRLDEVLARRMIAHDRFQAEIRDAADGVVLRRGDSQPMPTLAITLPLSGDGRQVGTLTMVGTYRHVVSNTLVVSIFSLLLSGLAYFLLKLLPLRALRRVYGELNAEKERAEVTLFSIGDAVIAADRLERIERMNENAAELTGWSMADARGRQVGDVFRIVDDKTGEPAQDPLRTAMARGVALSVPGHLSLRRRDGSLVAIEHNAAPVLIEGGQVAGGVLVFRDVTKQREQSRRLSWQAQHDSLTGLLNRSEFERRVASAIENYRETRRPFIVLYLDLDRFKVVNDSAGHVAGDELLRQVGDLFGMPLRTSDLLARLGGDEFGALLLGCPLERAKEIANTILNVVGNFRFGWDDKMFTIGVSIGIVEFAPEFRDVDDLLAAADSACYASKEGGRNRWSVYVADDELIQSHRIETDWTQQVIQAMAEDRMQIYFQEFRAMRAGTTDSGRHIEVLLRMVDSRGHVLLPGAFMPAAERHDLMPRLDLWVIEKAFSRHREIVQRFGDGATCSINLSGHSASDPRLAEQIRELASKHAIRPVMFSFELSETEVLKRLRASSELMVALTTDGFRFTLDDFGGAIGAFSYLRNLPIDMVKIDGSYIRDAATSEISQVMVAAINDIGHVMGVLTLAKSVDSDRILDEIREIGIDFAQGFLLHQPEPLDVIDDNGGTDTPNVH
ncbi:MAG: EAL domain-containing protein [Chromatiales bacterium]|nr:EAL domain-containing protein [Gammaproteobacteria bacterium]MCP5352465.1 EAL domain-containing protein [Chromatiales bacterium]